MAKKKTVNLFYIVDRSGSMSGLKDVVVTSFNEQLEAARQNKDVKTSVSMTQFNHDIEFTRWMTSIKDTKPLTLEEYRPSGNTSLHDAIGLTLNRIIDLKQVGDNNLVVIITDGHENSSKHFHSESVKRYIDSLTKEGNWTFSFVGANVDVEKVAFSMGVPLSNSVSYTSDRQGTVTMSNSLRDMTSNYIMMASVGGNVAANFSNSSEAPLDLRNTNPDADEELRRLARNAATAAAQPTVKS